MESNEGLPFHPTVVFDEPYWVHDFTRPSPEGWTAPHRYSVGRYDEHRPAMYTTELFGGERDHHVGLDLGGPAGTPVHAFDAGTVVAVTVNDEDGSYGPTLITKQRPTSNRGGWPTRRRGNGVLGPLRPFELGQHCSVDAGR